MSRSRALDGLTPRQAMHDPAWRDELEALLDDMAWQNRLVWRRRHDGSGAHPHVA